MQKDSLKKQIKDAEENAKTIEDQADAAWEGNESISDKFEFISWEVINKKEFPEDQWRIKNLIPRQGFTIMASISGERKTWVAMEMARCIAQGVDFLGREEFKTVAGNVLYIDMEQSEREFQRRGRLIGLNEGNKKIFILNRDDIDFSDGEAIMWLRHRIKTYQIDVVIADTFRAIAGGLKEQNAEEVREFFDAFKEFKNMGVAILWLDHLRKPTNFEGKVPKKEQLLGSQDKTACSEVLLMLKSELGGNEISIYQYKNRLAPEIKPFKAIMEDEIDENWITQKIKFSYGGLIEEAESQKERAKETILAALSVSEKTRQELLEIVHLEAKVGGRNTSEAIRELMVASKLSMRKNGRQNCYFLPKEGESELPPLDENEQGNFFDTS